LEGKRGEIWGDEVKGGEEVMALRKPNCEEVKGGEAGGLEETHSIHTKF
jgi:hypothetical protein